MQMYALSAQFGTYKWILSGEWNVLSMESLLIYASVTKPPEK